MGSCVLQNPGANVQIFHRSRGSGSMSQSAGGVVLQKSGKVRPGPEGATFGSALRMMANVV
jgi:hypothetical protein